MGRRVWSDDEVQELAKNFVCVADEVFNLDHAETPGAQFFRAFVKRCPPDISFGKTTKQGVYVMTPDAEFLGGHYARHNKANTIALLKKSLERWNDLVLKKGLTPQPIPAPATTRTWGEEGLPARAGGKVGAESALILQVVSRNLPLEGLPDAAESRGFWNGNWIDFSREEVLSFLPKEGTQGKLPDALFRRMGGRYLIDNVGGQTAIWREPEIRKATLSVEVVDSKDGLATLRFRGEFQAEAGPRAYDGKLYGEAVLDTDAARFRRFELVAAGIRKGSVGANGRLPSDPPSPVGHAFVIEAPADVGGTTK